MNRSCTRFIAWTRTWTLRTCCHNFVCLALWILQTKSK